jgi:hypothetical protein
MDQIPPSEGFRWHDLDQTLVAPKLSKLSAEMQKAFFKDEAEISFEGRKRGNSAYFLPAFLDKQLERTDEWARRKYEIYCECWYEQGHCISPEFVRAVCTHGILGIFQVRKGTIARPLCEADSENWRTAESALFGHLRQPHRDPCQYLAQGP